MKYNVIFLIFTAINLILLILLISVCYYFDIYRSAMTDFLIVFASAYGASYMYGNKNGYFLTTKQKWSAARVFAAIELVYISSISGLLLFLDDRIGFLNFAALAIMLLALIVMGIIAMIVSYFGIRAAEKRLVKRGVISSMPKKPE